jgi:toxin ParE1/3/4
MTVKNKSSNKPRPPLMANYRISNSAKEDLIRIYSYGVEKFGTQQADKYFNLLFEYFDIIAQRPFSFESVEHLQPGYRRCVCGSDSIYFKVSNDYIDIMAIVGKQELDNIL